MKPLPLCLTTCMLSVLFAVSTSAASSADAADPMLPGFETGLPGVHAKPEGQQAQQGTAQQTNTQPRSTPRRRGVSENWQSKRPSEARSIAFPFVNFNPGAEYADQTRMYQGIPSIAKTQGGRLWATWFGGGECEGLDNYVMLASSDDDGHSWTPPSIVIDVPQVRAGEPMVWVDPSGRLWAAWTVYPLRYTRRDFAYYKDLTGEDASLRRYMRDQQSAADQLWVMTCDNPDAQNPEWSDPRLIAWGVNCINKPTVLTDGTWIWPSASFGPDVPSRPLISKDSGETFFFGGDINVPDHPYADEYNVVERKDGSLYILNRTRDSIGETVSTDGGMSWAQMKKPEGIEHPSARQLLIKLDSGNWLLVKHGPIATKTTREQLMAFISRDEGKSWEGGLMLDKRRGISYPDGFQDKDGNIYVAYDYSRYNMPTVLMTTFTEADVLAGKPVSDKVRFRQIINRGTAKNTRY